MIIGIGGISRSGKSTLSEKLLKCFPGRKIAILHQDEYIKSGYNIPFIKDQIDWEDPESIDFQRLIYEFYWLAQNVDILILEGIFAFHNEDLNRMYNKKILMEIDFSTFIERKKKDKRWGKTPDWYFQHIWNSYFKFGHPEEMKDYLVLKGDEKISIDEIISYLNKESVKANPSLP